MQLPNLAKQRFPAELHISRSMQKLISKNVFDFRIDTAFEDVIHHCATANRKEQNGTWLTKEMKDVYIQLHHLGYAHSAETWLGDQLVGGLYGIRIGKLFFGESMFSKESNASKFAFICFVEKLKKENIHLIDCQVYTEHLESLGAEMISRADFIEAIKTYG